LDVMRQLPDNSVDAVVTDPPYGLSREPDIEEVLRHWLAGDDYEHRGGGFMGETWDSFVPGPAVWREVFRVLKPGGHILCFAGTRTVDLMGISLRLGGFEIRDCLQWLYGSGFPKSLDVSKAIDKHFGAERTEGAREWRGGQRTGGIIGTEKTNLGTNTRVIYDVPATFEGAKWQGWGTALKPANEPIILARKPLSEATVAENVLRWGTGGLNIDGCRLPIGRFPANVLLDEEAAAMLDEQSGEGRSTVGKVRGGGRSGGIMGKHVERSDKYLPYGYNDSGGASRFFYVAKASRRERTHNGQVDNKHPTVKPIKLMEYLVTLITPPGGIVLDPF